MVRPGKAVLLAIILGIGTQAYGSEFRPNEVIVKFKSSVRRTRLQMNTLYNSLGVKRVNHNLGSISGLDHLVLKDDMPVQDVVSELRKSEIVAYAQPNYILRALPIAEKMGALRALDEGDDGGAPVKVPCIFPGIHFPPGCSDDGDTDSGGLSYEMPQQRLVRL